MPGCTYGKVERRRGRVGNKLVFAGTRIPVVTITEWLANGFNDNQVIGEYPDLTPADIALAHRYQVSA